MMKDVSFKVLLSLQKQDARDIQAVSTIFNYCDSSANVLCTHSLIYSFTQLVMMMMKEVSVNARCS